MGTPRTLRVLTPNRTIADVNFPRSGVVLGVIVGIIDPENFFFYTVLNEDDRVLILDSAMVEANDVGPPRECGRIDSKA